MGTYHLRGSHVSLIARTHVKYSIRGGAGLIFVLLSLVAGLVFAAIVIDPVEGLKQQAEQMGQEANTKVIVERAVQEVGIPMIERFTGGDEDQAVYLVLDKPALVSAFIVILTFFLPFLVALGAFNQYAGDVGNRGLRYQLLRTERANIFVGRFLGTYVFTLLTLGALMTIVAVYLMAKAQFYPAGDVILWMLQSFLAMALYSLPWVALCGWISSALDSAFGSLAISLVVIIFYPVVMWFGARANDAVGYGTYALPWGWKWHLLHPDAGHFLAGVAVMLAFTALFGWLGLRHFAKRDL